MKLQTLFKAGVCIAAAPGLSYSGSAFAEVKDNTLRLDPSSPWNLVYADDSCRIMRVFGEDDQRVAFYIERFEPGDSFSMLAAGKPLRNIARRDFAHVRFGELHSEAEVRLTPGSLPEFEPALIFNTTRFDVADDDDGQRTDSNGASGPDIFGQQIAPETEAAINWISIRGRSRRTVVLNTGSMGAPMEAVRACTDNLMEHWGIDLDQHRNLASLPKPKQNPGRWMNANDYPTGLLRQGYQGIVKFRLSVDADGVPSACHIQQSSRPEGFDKAVCDALMRKARFEPAMTKDGTAIASYWRNTVRFKIP